MTTEEIFIVHFTAGPSESYDTVEEAKDAVWRQLLTGEARAVTHVSRQAPPKIDMPPVDRSNVCTTDGTPHDPENPNGETKPTGQHERYVVLCDEERAKGFVRPVRSCYVHKGVRPCPGHVIRDLTAEEAERYKAFGYVKFEQYPDDGSPSVGRFWTEAQLTSGCGCKTTMGQALAETYARCPNFYGATFCCGCQKHIPVEEFVWDGTNEVVGS